MMHRSILAVMTLACLGAAPPRPAAFDIVPLGVEGGIVDGATTAYVIAAHGRRRGAACDAGTLVAGIRTALRRGGFPGETGAARVLHDRIAAYLITHAHLDHVAGLVLASPDDSPKPVMALPAVNAALVDGYFNGRGWPNMTDRGPPPRLGKYRLQDLIPAGAPVAIADTGLTVTALPLSHGSVPSTAFLLRAGDDALLCMGDTGADAVERSGDLARVWQAVAPLVRTGQLRGMVVEASYPDPRPDAQLHGHLTPKWLTAELHRLAEAVGDRAAMRGLTVVVGHIKPSIDGGGAERTTVARQLEAGNDLAVRYIIAAQGRRMEL